MPTEPLMEINRVAVDRGAGWRTRLLVSGWLIALVGAPALAIVGGLGDGLPGEPAVHAPLAVAAQPLAVAAPRPAQREAPNPGVLTATIVLNNPARAGMRLTTVDVAVGGYLEADAGSMRVALETAGEVVVSQATVLPALVIGEHAATNRRFELRVRLVLPARRPAGAVAVRVAVLDRAGRQMATVHRPLTLTPIERPTLGDDGLLGGLVFADS